MIAIIGLGNPGNNYDKTVHNLGFMSVDHFANSNSLTFTKNKYFGKVTTGLVRGEKVILLKPQTFMNLSGKSVQSLVSELKLDITQIIVIVDDIDLSFGDIRVRSKGSGGTHNGLRDIVNKVGENFARIRLGAGRPEHGDLAAYVLSKIPEDKLELISSQLDKVDKIIEYFVENKTIEGIDVSKL